MVFGYEACARIIRDGRLSANRSPASLVGVAPDAMPEFDDLLLHMQRWLLMTDDPRHAELRRRMNRGFAPAAVEKLRHKVEAIVEDLLDDVQKNDTADLIKNFAYPLPVRVICQLLGLPGELHARCVDLSTALAVWIGDPRHPPESARAAQRAAAELESYFAAAIRARRGSQEGDLLDLLIDAAAGVDGMSEQDLHAQCVMLLFGGHETTRNLIGNGILALLKNPEALHELRENEGLWPAAIEEMLRYESPVQAVSRSLKCDAEIEGVQVPAGSSLAFMIGAANRDPRQFAYPDRLNFRRSHNRHLAFGGDAHVCLGVTLARLEGRLAIRAAIRRLPNLRLADARPDWGSNFGLRGLATLRVQH
jgi:cytochrome P450